MGGGASIKFTAMETTAGSSVGIIIGLVIFAICMAAILYKVKQAMKAKAEEMATEALGENDETEMNKVQPMMAPVQQ